MVELDGQPLGDGKMWCSLFQTWPEVGRAVVKKSRLIYLEMNSLKQDIQQRTSAKDWASVKRVGPAN